MSAEFVTRLGKATSRWGLGESVGCVWGTLLFSGSALTQKELVEASGYSVALVSSSLSRLKELGFVASAGRRGRKRLYVAVMSVVDGLESFLKRFVDMEIVPTVKILSERIHGIKDAKQRSNAERILEEYRRGKVFLDTLLSLMEKHKNLCSNELKQILPR